MRCGGATAAGALLASALAVQGAAGASWAVPRQTPVLARGDAPKAGLRRVTALQGGAVKTPAETYNAYAALGKKQGTMAPGPMALQSVFAGVFIAFGAVLAMSVGAALPAMKAENPGLQKIILGAFGLPFGLLLVVLTGAQLFTGNTALVSAAVLEGTVTPRQLAQNWLVSYFGNFAGALGIIGIIRAAGLFPQGAAVAAVAASKCSLSFGEAFLRGILCNFIVCMALWQANAAGDLCGKALGIWLPISSFVAMGFEHSVANMAFIPLGMVCGADVSVSEFLFNNLLPVTLGNILSGSIFVGAAYHYLYGTKKSKI